MDEAKNVGREFLSVAEKAAKAPALIYPDREYSFSELANLVKAFAQRFRENGVDHNSTLHVTSSDTLIYLASAFASALLGARFVQFAGELEVLKNVGVTHWFSDGLVEDSHAKTVLFDEGWSPAEVNLSSASNYCTSNENEPWLVVHSSGTTGYPKFFHVTHQMVLLRSRAVADQFQSPEARLCSLFPCFSRPFLSRALAALLCGRAIVVGGGPPFWKEAGVTMVSGSPQQVRALYDRCDFSERFAMIELLGARMEEALTQKLLNNFDLIDGTYGAGETNKTWSNMTRWNSDGSIHRWGVARDSEMEIVDNSGKPVPVGSVGELRIRNPYLARSYLEDPEATALAFRGDWFYPGDLAFWSENDVLEIVGRDDDVINVRGQKISGIAIDREISQVDGIAGAVCFRNPKSGADDELFAFVVFEESSNKMQSIATAKYRCGAKFGRDFVPRVFREIGQIPLKPDGKPDRRACADFILSVARKSL